MSLMTYKARPWAKAIASKVADGTMPPWHADPKSGTFVGARGLSVAHKDVYQVGRRRAPEGNAADLAPAPVYTEEWISARPTRCCRCRRTIRFRRPEKFLPIPGGPGELR